VEIEHQRERWGAQLEQEWEDVRKSLTRRLADAVTEAARRALTDLADTTLEEAMTRAFRRRLADLSESDRHAIADGGGAAEIATAFELQEETRKTLAKAVREGLGRDVRFVRADGLIGGVELRTRGWKMSWTISEYLRDFEDRLAEAMASGAAHHVER
jgi:F-type H+-transporting ATPase subunit b